MTRVWPDTVVVEGNLPVHMAALRRALGDGHNGNRYVVTIPGRGYSFAAPIKIAETPRRVPSRPAAIAHGHNLPAQLTRLIGRADIVSRLAGRLEHTRLLTITGPPGTGKTSVALAVAEQRSVVGLGAEHNRHIIPFKDPLPDKNDFFLWMAHGPPWVFGSRLPERFDRQPLRSPGTAAGAIVTPVLAIRSAQCPTSAGTRA